MARRVPTSETHLIHPALSISLLAAWIAATIAIVAALCGTRYEKKPTPPPSESSLVNLTTKNLETGSSSSASGAFSVGKGGTEAEGEGGSGADEAEALPLPLPPIMRVNDTNLAQMPRSVSVSHHHKGFMASPSIHLPRSFSVAKAAKHLPFTKEERILHGRKDKVDSHSLWQKTIILGEKCRVPKDDHDIYDDKGQKMETYRTKGPSSVPVSRTNSFKEPEAVSNPG